MFQIVRVADGWQVRSTLLPLEWQMDTRPSRRIAVDDMRTFLRTRREWKMRERVESQLAQWIEENGAPF